MSTTQYKNWTPRKVLTLLALCLASGTLVMVLIHNTQTNLSLEETEVLQKALLKERVFGQVITARRDGASFLLVKVRVSEHGSDPPTPQAPVKKYRVNTRTLAVKEISYGKDKSSSTVKVRGWFTTNTLTDTFSTETGHDLGKKMAHCLVVDLQIPTDCSRPEVILHEQLKDIVWYKTTSGTNKSISTYVACNYDNAALYTLASDEVLPPPTEAWRVTYKGNGDFALYLKNGAMVGNCALTFAGIFGAVLEITSRTKDFENISIQFMDDRIDDDSVVSIQYKDFPPVPLRSN